MKPYAFGIDIGGTAIKLGLFQTDGTLLEKWQLPTRTEEDGTHILPDALESIQAVMTHRSILWDDKYAFHAFRDTEFVLAELGNDAGIYGCVRMLLQEE